MPVRGSLASLAMATTGCPVGQLKDANGECQWVYVPEQQQQQQQQQDAPIQGKKGGLLDDWILHESPPTDDYGKDSIPFFPIDDWIPTEPTPTEPTPTAPSPTAPSPTAPSPTDAGVVLDDPSWSPEPRSPYSRLGTINSYDQVPGLADYVKDWERPGWETQDWIDAGLFTIAQSLAGSDPVGFYEEGKYPGVPTPPNYYDEIKKIDEEYQALWKHKDSEERKKYPDYLEDDEAKYKRILQLNDERLRLSTDAFNKNNEMYDDLFKIGTPYETKWSYTNPSSQGDWWKVAPEAGEPFGGWGIYTGGGAGDFIPANEDGLLGMVGDGESSDGITTPLPSIPPPAPMPIPIPIPDNSLPPPIEEYNSSPHGAGSADQFEYFLDSVPPGVYTHESMLQDFLGRPPNAEELYMLDLHNNQFNMPVIDPTSPGWEPPKNNDGLLGIVGGGLVDQPIWDA